MPEAQKQRPRLDVRNDGPCSSTTPQLVRGVALASPSVAEGCSFLPGQSNDTGQTRRRASLQPKGVGARERNGIAFPKPVLRVTKVPAPSFSPKPPGRRPSFTPSALLESCTPSPRTAAWATLKTAAVMSQKREKQVSCAL